MISFTKQEDGSFTQLGECNTPHGRFQWQRDDGKWEGWSIEPLPDLMARMNRAGPYKFQEYRILPVEKKELVIKPTCTAAG